MHLIYRDRMVKVYHDLDGPQGKFDVYYKGQFIGLVGVGPDGIRVEYTDGQEKRRAGFTVTSVQHGADELASMHIFGRWGGE